MTAGLLAGIFVGRGIPGLAGSFVLPGAAVLAALLVIFAVMAKRVRRRWRELAQSAHVAESSLRQSEERFQAVFQHAAVGITLMNLDGEFRLVNRRFCEILGYSSEELRGKRGRDITVAEDWLLQEPQALLLKEGKIGSYSIDKRYTRKDGRSIWVNVTISAVRIEKPYLIGVIQEIGSRKAAEDAMRESETKFRTLAENAQVLIAIAQDSKIVYVNRFFRTVTGYSLEEFAQMQIVDMVAPQYRDMLIDVSDRVQSGESPAQPHELVLVGKNGQEIWVAFTAAPMLYKGQPAVIGAGFDITERKRVEAALRESESRLAKAKEAAEAANTAKDHFLAVLSHELRTPLSPVLGTASILAEDPRLPEEIRQDMQMIHRNVELETRLIDDLLDVTRIERGKLELRQGPVEMKRVLHQAAEICEADMTAKGISLSMHLCPGEKWLRADAARLQQVFWNLINNAVKFTPGGGTITIRCREEPAQNGEGKWLVVDVEDTGVGIEPERLPKMFAAFEQGGRRVTKKYGGLGLGLAISRAIVELHGGRISASSPGPGKGATFTVRLPAKDVGAVAPGRREKPAGRSSTQPLRILLLEDHADTARMLKRILHADGHEVVVANSLVEGRQRVAEGRFDLLICDVGLPDGNGLDLMQTVRAQGWSCPGIALSGYGHEQDMAESYQAGFASHITKPIDVPRLKQAIAEVVGGE